MPSRRTTRVLLAVAILTLAVGGCRGILGERGSGVITTETRSVSGFDQIDLAGQGRVEIDFGDSEALVIEAEDNLMPLLTSDVSGGTLVLGSTRNIDPTVDVVYSVTVTSLNSLRLSGSGEIHAPDFVGNNIDIELGGSGFVLLNGIDVGEVGAEISGSGNIELSGIADRLNASISGSGSLDADALTVSGANVSISGSGHAVVNATDSLVADVSGSGSVEYLGDPSVRAEVSGSGNVDPR